MLCKHGKIGLAFSQKSLRISMFSFLEIMKGRIASWEQEQKIIQQEIDERKNIVETKNVVIERKKLVNRIGSRLINKHKFLKMTKEISASDLYIRSVR